MGIYNVISLLHIINDTRIWPDFFYTSSSDYYKEQILIGSLVQDNSAKVDMIGIGIDSKLTLVTYKSKTVLEVLTEIAGLLVL